MSLCQPGEFSDLSDGVIELHNSSIVRKRSEKLICSMSEVASMLQRISLSMGLRKMCRLHAAIPK